MYVACCSKLSCVVYVNLACLVVIADWSIMSFMQVIFLFVIVLLQPVNVND